MIFSSSLKLNHIFRRLYRTTAYADSYLVLYAKRNHTPKSRVGFTVSKKLGHAVVRNRTRRRLREIYRLGETTLQPGWDIVVVARSKAVDAPYEALTASFAALCQRAGITVEQL